MQNDSTLTVVIPTYRRPRLLKRAISSVTQQNYSDVKVMVFDNDSGDETKTVVTDLMLNDHRISYHCHEKNIGAPANFAFGAKQVNTKFFAFLSDDDIVMPNCYRDAIDIMIDDTDIMLVASKVMVIDEYYNLMGPPLGRQTNGRCGPLKALSTIPFKKMPTWTGMVFRSDVIATIGVPDPEIFIVDVEYVTKACYHFPFVVTDQIGGVFTGTHAGWECKEGSYLLEKPAGREKMYDLFLSEYDENKSMREMWEKRRKRYYKKIFKRGMKWIHESNREYVTDAASILVNYQSKLKGRLLLWLSRTTSGTWFFSVAIKPWFVLKDFFKKRKSPGKRGRVPSSDDEIKCVNYFKSLDAKE